MLKPASTQRHPVISLLLLLLLMIAGAVTFMLLAFIVVTAVYGMKEMVNASTGGASSIEVIKVLQLFISTGMFIFPALFFARLESKNWTDYLKFKGFPFILILITLLIMLSSGPLLELSAELNRNKRSGTMDAWQRA